MPATIDLTSCRFGRLIVQNRSGTRGGRVTWQCLCDCGAILEAVSHALTSGHTASCGCWRNERNASTPTQHGHAKRGEGLSPTYRTWQAMLTRCSNPKVKSYADYGARGITVCGRWNTFANFLADMGERPPGTTLDRKKNDVGYEVGNCRWATKLTQARNTRANVRLTYQGEEMTQAEFSELTGLKQSTVSYRMRAGWTAEQIAITPAHTGNRVASKLGDEVEVPKGLL